MTDDRDTEDADDTDASAGFQRLAQAAFADHDPAALAELVRVCGPSAPFLAAALDHATNAGQAPCAVIVAPDVTTGRWQVIGASRQPEDMPYVNILAALIRDLIEELADENRETAEADLATRPSEGNA
jgi:citrate lyase beta subunit